MRKRGRPKKYKDWQNEILKKCGHKWVYRFTKHMFALNDFELYEFRERLKNNFLGKSTKETGFTQRELKTILKQANRIRSHRNLHRYIHRYDGVDSERNKPIRTAPTPSWRGGKVAPVLKPDKGYGKEYTKNIQKMVKSRRKQNEK
jgi:hypothetical protein